MFAKEVTLHGLPFRQDRNAPNVQSKGGHYNLNHSYTINHLTFLKRHKNKKANIISITALKLGNCQQQNNCNENSDNFITSQLFSQRTGQFQNPSTSVYVCQVTDNSSSPDKLS